MILAGAGDDNIIIAVELGSNNGVRFIGKTTIKAEAGNDALTLGNNAGDPFTLWVYDAIGNVIDGGSGINTGNSLTRNILPGVIGASVSITNWV
jgi:hypothetical protein